MEGNESLQIIAERYGTAPTYLRRWISKYDSMGVTAFYQTGNKALYNGRKRTDSCRLSFRKGFS